MGRSKDSASDSTRTRAGQGCRRAVLLRGVDARAVGAILAVELHQAGAVGGAVRGVPPLRPRDRARAALADHAAGAGGDERHGVPGLKAAMELAGYTAGRPRLPLSEEARRASRRSSKPFGETQELRTFP